MLFGYDGADESQLIRGYDIYKDKIIVEYLDGSVGAISFNQINIDKIIDMMLKQAQERNIRYNKYKNNKTIEQCELDQKSITMICLGTILVVLIAYLKLLDPNISYDNEMICKLVEIISGIVLVHQLKEHNENNTIIDNIEEQEEEIEKYKIYLENKELIEELIEKIDIFEGIKKSSYDLNINTLDTFSLKELKIIRENIEKYTSNKTHSLA